MADTEIKLFQLSYRREREFLKILVFIALFVAIIASPFFFHHADQTYLTNLTNPCMIIVAAMFLLLVKVAHGTLTYKVFAAIDGTDTVHIPYNTLTFSKWQLSDNSVKTNYGRNLSESRYLITKVRFRFAIANIAQIERVHSFNAPADVWGWVGPDDDMTQDVITQLGWFYASGAFASEEGDVRIVLKRLEPITYGGREYPGIPIQDLWDKSRFRNVEIFLSLQDPDSFLSEVERRMEK